eukprot:Seg1714.5 transcript_id=Seg1714.5/GoldUCD/mRNA.D3Y31 product="Ankyrin repeat domain-containing protein SOWAHC" protein_id=Seg1714.5/GoldUCD/D3Y31
MSSVGNKSDEENQPSSGEASPSADDTITLPAVKGYITDHGGRVKHTDIVNFFRRQLSDPVAKGRNRADFKDVLSRIASFRNEGGERYIILKSTNGRNSTNGSSPNGRRRQDERAGSSPDRNHFQDARFGSDSTLASQASCDSGIVLDPRSLASHVAARARDISGSTDSLDDELMADWYDDEGVEDHIVHGHSEFSDEEKRWLMLAAICDCQQLAAMMDQNPGLSGKRDFITSALHWGAKLGRRDMVRLIADSGADINARAGQTALHLAAMQGHDIIIKMLVNDYGADVHARDYAGKKPKDLVKDTVAPDIQRKLGRSLILDGSKPVVRASFQFEQDPKKLRKFSKTRALSVVDD